MVMAVNNAPLLVQSMDISGLSDSFRDGQKLRQDYDNRQAQKELGKIMQTEDHNGRLDLARQSRYAGILIPELQKYDEDRQKAALDNLGASADIGKTYGETSKLNAESGKIGAETTGVVRENTAGIQNDISALAVTRDPKLFALGLGEMTRQGLITPERTGAMLKLITTDPTNAAKVMQSMVMANPELAKLFKPTSDTIDAGDKIYSVTNNAFTGEQNAPNAQITKGASPDNVLDNQTSRLNNQNTVAGSMYNSDNSLEGQKYVADTNYAGKVYGADSAAQTASNAQAISWYNAKTGAAVAQQNANTNQAKNTPVAGANGQPVRKLNATEQKKLFEIQDQQDADKSVIQTLDKMMKLVDNSYSGVAASGRAKGMSNIGLGGERADNTVLYDNLATSQALGQLKATFGAAPTEGERKILMDIQASASKTPAQKKAIISQAFRAVQVRQAHREKLANGIRTGQYMVPTTPTLKSSTNSGGGNSKGSLIISGILGGK